MLTTDQVDHFRTFGFAVLRGYLADRIGFLRAEVGAAIRDAYAASYDERAVDGISGPETDDERDRTLRYARDGFEQAFRGFDRDRYPVWRDWLAGAAAHPRRAPVIERMRRAGVLDLPRALEGW